MKRRHFLAALSALSAFPALARSVFAAPSQSMPTPSPLNTPEWLLSEGVPALSPEEAADHVAIEQTLNRFCSLVDRDEPEALFALFAPDIRLKLDSEAPDATEPVVARGMPSVRQWHEAHRARQKTAGHFYRRQLLVPVIHVEKEAAQVFAYLTLDRWDKQQDRILITMGRVEFGVTRAPDKSRWLIDSWTQTLHFTHQAAPHVWLFNGKQELKALEQG